MDTKAIELLRDKEYIKAIKDLGEVVGHYGLDTSSFNNLEHTLGQKNVTVEQIRVFLEPVFDVFVRLKRMYEERGIESNEYIRNDFRNKIENFERLNQGYIGEIDRGIQKKGLYNDRHELERPLRLRSMMQDVGGVLHEIDIILQ
ncbi:MAG: hypothetical protein HZA35_01450 [Parcubacteria group bacterium]|nr:hypothetical protein [Parcubacteria group bacterium]